MFRNRDAAIVSILNTEENQEFVQPPHASWAGICTYATSLHRKPTNLCTIRRMSTSDEVTNFPAVPQPQIPNNLTVFSIRVQIDYSTPFFTVSPVLKKGKLPGAKPAAGYGAALQAHLDDTNNALEAVDAAKVVRNTDTEEGALQSWMSVIVSANHVLYGTCPPLLVDIDTCRAIARGRSWMVEGLRQRYQGALQDAAQPDSSAKEMLRKRSTSHTMTHWRQRVLPQPRIRHVPAMLKKPVSTHTSVIVCVLELVLDQAGAHRGEVWETHNKVVKHWLFLLGELGRWMSPQRCVCEVVGTDRPFERDRKQCRD
ncbi:hypothetical protein B0H13DRAFT_1936044 [Mycena leptocephala]|nr:hypothetical protein B0H13DRAFT_1936044 [Mycena leptocephala]